MKMLRMCLDWRVLVGLAVVGVGIYAVAPGMAAAALPILLLAICPLSMLFMMIAMQKGGRDDGPQTLEADADPTREERLARLRTEQANLAEQIDALEQDESRSQANGVPGPGAQERRPRVSRRGRDLER